MQWKCSLDILRNSVYVIVYMQCKNKFSMTVCFLQQTIVLSKEK